MSQRNPLGFVREDGFAHHGDGHIKYIAPCLDVTRIAKLSAVPFFDTLQSQSTHAPAIPLVKQRFNRFAVQADQIIIGLVFALARQAALFNDFTSFKLMEFSNFNADGGTKTKTGEGTAQPVDDEAGGGEAVQVRE